MSDFPCANKKHNKSAEEIAEEEALPDIVPDLDHPDGDLWVFGYGSLLWKHGFKFIEAVPSYICHFERGFWQGSTDHRGVPGKPGRCVTLLPREEGIVHGLAFRVAKEDVAATLIALDMRERCGYDRVYERIYYHEVGSCTSPTRKNLYEGKLLAKKALVYIANKDNDEYLGPAPLDEMALQIATSAGDSGPNHEYLFKMCDGLREIQAPDEHCFTLEIRVREMMAELERKRHAESAAKQQDEQFA